MSRSIETLDFGALRPRVMALLELHRSSATEPERAAVMAALEEMFLAAAWHVAQDLLENGWRPGFVGAAAKAAGAKLRVVGGAEVERPAKRIARARR